MFSDEISIGVSNLSKCYQIYENPIDRLKQFILPKLKRLIKRQGIKFYKEFWALRDISFQVYKGETIGIIGKNGSGKSTLLQMICGTLSPTSGTVEVNGRIAALLELGSGFNPEFSGRENIYLNAAILGLSKEEIDFRFADIVAFADIDGFIDQPVKTYSSGMYVRLAFAVAVHVDPDILIIDEALSVGDIRFQNKCIRKINEIKKNGVTILFVSHSSGQVEALCDRVIWINDSEVRAIGEPSILIREYLNFMIHGLEKDSEPENVQQPLSLVGQDVWSWQKIDSSFNIQKNSAVKITAIRVAVGKDLNPVVVTAEAEKFIVEAEIFFGEYVDAPLLALGVFNSLNEPIVHFNTENINQKVNSINAGVSCTVEFHFTFPLLRDGQYLLALGIDDGIQNSNRVLFHIYDAWAFHVKKSITRLPQGGYLQIVDPQINLGIIQKNE